MATKEPGDAHLAAAKHAPSLVCPRLICATLSSACLPTARYLAMFSATTILSAMAAFELAMAAPIESRTPTPPKSYKHHGGPVRGDALLVQLGPRPYYLVDELDEGDLKDKLESCKNEPKSTSSFSISHRGAPLEFPEHSRQGYDAAVRMGAGENTCD
jgi:glycerophosphoryl diester phosphodiesterase